jgi:hydrogenase small subunit
MTELLKEIDILSITGGLGCDGDTIAMTAATQPSIEDVVLGGIPGIPKVNFHNPFLAYEVGEDFMKFFHDAAAGRIEPFILVIEGSIPNEENKAEGYWTGYGTDQTTGQPITVCEWIDRLQGLGVAPWAWMFAARGRLSRPGPMPRPERILL